MKHQIAAILLPIAVLASPLFAADLSLERPQTGKVDIFKTADLKPGMKATAWTVFSGNDSRTDTGGDHRAMEERLGPPAGRHPGQAGRPGRAHECGGRDERQPSLHRRQTGGSDRAAPQRLFAGCHLRHHAGRTDVGDQGSAINPGPPTHVRPTKLQRAARRPCRATCWRRPSRQALCPTCRTRRR